MYFLRLLVNLVLLITFPSTTLFAHIKIPILTVNLGESHEAPLVPLTSYDDILLLIEELECGIAENRYSLADLDLIGVFLSKLAMQGADPEQLFEIEHDLQEMAKANENPFYYALVPDEDFTFHPAIYFGDREIIHCNWISKQWRQVKNFVKKHKTAIIIGAVVVIAVATIYGVVAATSTAGAATAATAGQGNTSSPTPSSSDNNYIISQSQDLDLSLHVQSAMNDRIRDFKEYLQTEPFFSFLDSSLPYGDFSLGEQGRILGSIFAHESLKNFESALPDQTLPSFCHQEIDKSFSTDYTPIFASSEKRGFQSLLYQTRGEQALNAGFLDLALHDFGKVIELNPMTPIPYVDRGATFFETGNYENSLQDYYSYSTLASTSSFSIPEFVFGFSSSIPKGIYDSGEGMFLFLSDFIQNPIQTSRLIWDAFSTLSHLVRNKQWEILSEVLSPEVYQLAKNWNNYSSRERGELAGYAFGKYGSDIITPGAIAKAMSKGLKGAQEISSLWQSFHAAEKTLLLDSLAGYGDTAKFAQVIQASKATITLGDDLGFSFKQMATLKEAGTLDQTIAGLFNHVQKNSFLKQSYNRIKNAEDFLKPYRKQFMTEVKVRELIHQTGIRTFPRPKGIPESFRVQISKEGAGMLYTHPKHEHTSIRVMPSKPYSPNPCQREPYIKQLIDGQWRNINGKPVRGDSPEAHIPLKKFIYRG